MEEDTNKQSSTKKNDKDTSEDMTGTSKNKTKKFHKKHSKAKREGEMILRMTHMIRTVQSVKQKEGHSRLTTLIIVTKLLQDPRKRNKGQLTKKEFHALVSTQWKRFIDRKSVV